MSASSQQKNQGWMDELKKTSSKKNVFENIEKDRFLEFNSLEKDIVDIPEIEDITMDERLNETPPKTTFRKELNVDILKSSNINLDDKVDLTMLLETLEADEDIEEKDEVWTWHQLFTQITAEIADEK
ncbi:hypothetical protein PVAND_004413 [Polypedilum vanderplanki]|uniref:PH domain-containing protein n=1 Tax=Polypedilum vanderplanki TaxID=319348 RepID=A0A9J6BXH4_POLVA|nr:hypothetical protein PVAND_004413 [Polypedilum vanderplanki]